MKTKDSPYKKVQKIWYDKLKKEGFEDIEDNTSGLLKEWDFNFFRNGFCQVKYECNKMYYYKAKEILTTHDFKSPIHKKIWGLHCDGISERAIVTQLGKYKKSWVPYIIAEIAKIEGLPRWSKRWGS